MSADNWRRCPACNYRDMAEINKKREALEDDYGKVSQHEYRRRGSELIAAEHLVMGRGSERDNFREDYGFHIHKGVLHAEYHGACEDCQHVLKFTAYIDAVTGNPVVKPA